jgi:DUF4097 and DUF4098 domain-containing protein YvlB
MLQGKIRLIACVFTAVAVSGCSVNLSAERLHRTEDRRFTVNGRPELVLKTFDGAITVRSWDKPEVLVTIDRQAGDEEALKSIEVKSDQQGNTITVEVLKPEHQKTLSIGIHIGRSAALTVSVPRNADVTARSGDGAITVSDLAGRLDLGTGDGSVSVRGAEGDLIVRTGDGAVTLDGVRGQVELNTGDGSVKVDGVLQRVRARTGDGAILVRAGAGSTATAEDWEVETGDGSVNVQLPEGFGAELDARSNDGRVNVSGLALTGATDRDEHKEVRGRIGAGGSRLKIRTGDGGITVGRS